MFAGLRTFDVDAPFVARNAFAFDGVSYEAGAMFPARDLGLELPKLWELWSNYMIDNTASQAKPIAPPPPAQPKQQGRAARR